MLSYSTMSDTKFKTYCRIMDYLLSPAGDREFGELLRGTCADMAVTSTGGKPGITLLIPQDKALRKKIADLAYSVDPKDAAKACDMLHAMVLKDYFGDAADWKTKTVINSLYPAQVVEVASASGNSVTFKNGAKAERDDKFISSAQHKKLAVWKLTGEIPVTTDKPAPAQSKGKKKGAYEATPSVMDNLRWKIGAAVENEYAAECSARSGRIGGAMGAPKYHREVFVEYTMSLVDFIIGQSCDKKTGMPDDKNDLFWERVLPLISFHNVDFYNLVEPHKVNVPSSDYLIPDYVIRDWWEQNRTQCFIVYGDGSVAEKCCKALSSAPSKWAGCAIYSSRSRLQDTIDRLRRRVFKCVQGQPRAAINPIAEAYAKLAEENTIDGLGPVFPAGLAAYYAREKNLKMAQDELRYITYMKFRQLERSMSFDAGLFREITDIIGNYGHAANPEERARAMLLLNAERLPKMIQPQEKVNEICWFVNSTQFLFVPMTADEAKNPKYKDIVERLSAQDTTNAVLNLEKAIHLKHDRLLSGPQLSSGVEGLVAALKRLRPDTLPEHVKVELDRLMDTA